MSIMTFLASHPVITIPTLDTVVIEIIDCDEIGADGRIIYGHYCLHELFL